jgi:hypothetical protein
MDNKIILLPLANKSWQFTRTGLNIVPGLEYKEWEELGIMLQLLASAIEFAIGDWLIYGKRAYGEMYAQAILETGKSYGTLTNYVWVARHIESSRRRENLDFGHHSAVASLPPSDQDALLSEAQECGLTVRQLQANVRAHKANGDNRHQVQYCPRCGQQWNGE